MKWLKDIDSSFDSLLTDCYRQREMEMERHINKIRCVGLVALFLFEIIISIYARGFDWSFIFIDLATLSITLIICLIINTLANQNNYKAWLKLSK